MGAFVNIVADPAEPKILEYVQLGSITEANGLDKPLYNVFHYHRVSGSGFPDLGALCAAMNNLIVGDIQPLQNVRAHFAFGRLRPLDDPLNPGVVSLAQAGDGGVAGDPISAALALVVRLNTGVRGRSFNGRKHFGGWSEADQDSGDEWDAGMLAAFAAFLPDWLDPIDDGNGVLYRLAVVSSQLSDFLASTPTFTGADVTSLTVNKIAGTMRRRKEVIPS